MNNSKSNCETSEMLISNLSGKVACVIFLFFVVAVTVFGNFMLIFKVVRRAGLHRKINVFVISLAVADCGVALLVMLPSIFQDFISHSLLHGKLIRKIVFAFDCMFTTSSILHFTCMNVDRYIAVSTPLKYFQKMNAKVVSMLIIFSWILSSAISVTIVLLNSENVGCEYSLIVEGVASVMGAVLAFYLPLLLNIVASVKIVLKVRNRNKFLCNELEGKCSTLRRQQHKIETRVTRTIMILQGTFAVCTTPFFLLLFLVNLFGIKASYTAWFMVAWLGYSNSTINPYLYYFLNKRFKNTDKNNHREHIQFGNKI
ncbi:D(2) dopamine receptor A-like [Saccostrea echinata]|uniref:D(2) dopamine receptor A-like n=1 Tax=Saccostrea echinata TaxID=191078 RepID=UPI002A7F3B0A|nr:D(2) dopamine receptor A-like [Saccostrea echinata]